MLQIHQLRRIDGIPQISAQWVVDWLPVGARRPRHTLHLCARRARGTHASNEKEARVVVVVNLLETTTVPGQP